MKNLRTTAAALALLVVAACGDDGQPSDADIVGALGKLQEQDRARLVRKYGSQEAVPADSWTRANTRLEITYRKCEPAGGDARGWLCVISFKQFNSESDFEIVGLEAKDLEGRVFEVSDGWEIEWQE